MNNTVSTIDNRIIPPIVANIHLLVLFDRLFIVYTDSINLIILNTIILNYNSENYCRSITNV